MSYLSKLELNLILKLSDKIFNDSIKEDIAMDMFSKEDLIECQTALSTSSTKYDIMSSLDTLYYYFSIILSDIRQEKRKITTKIFDRFPKLMDEKSVLEKKLDAIPEYANLKTKEEYLFQFLEHINSIKNNITWLLKEEQND